MVNGSPYDASKGKSGETYAIDSDNNYIGYFTDWSMSPNYSYVYNKYREAHPELGLAALTGSSAVTKDRGRSSADIVSLSAIPVFRALRAVGDGGEDVSPFTAPEVVYLTGKKALSAEAAQSILTGLGLGSTYDPTAYYVTETVTVNGTTVANLAAKWTINSAEQWECTMMVYDPDAECYVWEDTVPTGYTSDHSSANKRVTWRNDINKSDLVLMKSLERKEDDGSGALTDKELTDSDKSIEYAFTVVLTGLYPNDGYSYVTDTGTTGFTADENGSKTLTVKLKHDGSVTFRDLPVGTVYTVSENLPTESNITYETRWNKYEGDAGHYAASAADASAEGTSMTDRLDRYEWVRFDNTKITKKTIDVNVEKFWFADWYGEAGYESSAETALVTLQRNDGMRTVTPDDGTRTLDSSNGWKDTFADLPVKVDGNDVSYTLGEITVGGYKPGIISSEVGELTYGTVNTLNDPANQELAYFAYKIGYTFKIGDETYANKAVELCKTADNKVYMFYDGDLYTVSDDGSGNSIAVKYTGNNKRTEGTQNRFMKKTDPKNAADFPEVYETYVNYDSTKVYFKNETDADALPLGRVIAKKGGGYFDILYILHSDGIFYKAEKTNDEEHLKLGRPVFRWNTSDDVISDPEGNIKYIVTNVKEKTYSVAISKKVEGNLGNKDRRFGFDVIAGSLNGKFPVTRTYGETTTLEEIEFSAGVGSVEISHGETVVISNLPEGMNLLIREREYKEYDVRSENASGSIVGDPDKGGEINFVMDSNQSVTFTNTLVGTIPTGIELNIATVIVLGLLTAGLLILMKKKQGSDPDSSEQ
ncbi:MAG: DUF5979 domain-containing protein [Ruminococcus sp.]|nr:DUF5979 domain-containing protein [Ruminococcus sp.]